LPDVGWPLVLQAEILREWNELDDACSPAKDGIALCQQIVSMGSVIYLLRGYAVLLRALLAHGELDAACAVLQELERIGLNMNQPIYTHVLSYFTTIDQVRFWLACGKLNRAAHWVEEMDLAGPHGHPLVRERQEVARVRVLLAQALPKIALQRLEPLLESATKAQRWRHVIEIRLLQALVHQMLHEVPQALGTLWEAVRLAEPEGYIRCFVDEATPMEALLSQLREQQRKHRPTPYLDTVLAAFPQQTQPQKRLPKQTRPHTR